MIGHNPAAAPLVANWQNRATQDPKQIDEWWAEWPDANIAMTTERFIVVDVDPTKLQAYHLSLEDVSKRIIAENIDLPAGIARQSNTEYVIRSLGYFNSPKDAANIPVGSFNGQLVALKQVASAVVAAQPSGPPLKQEEHVTQGAGL